MTYQLTARAPLYLGDSHRIDYQSGTDYPIFIPNVGGSISFHLNGGMANSPEGAGPYTRKGASATVHYYLFIAPDQGN